MNKSPPKQWSGGGRGRNMEKSLKPNHKYECITDEAFRFTKGNIYKTDADGIIYDDDNSDRPVISVPDDYFFEKFKDMVMVSEIEIGQSRACYYEGVLSIMDYHDTVEFSTDEAIQLRDFLKQLELY